MCECAQSDCTGRITIQVAAYEHVRSFASRFLVKQGHEVGEADRVIGEGDGYVIVEQAAVVAAAGVATASRRHATAPVA